MFADVTSPEDALKASVEALREIVSLFDRLGLEFPAVHAATALHAVCSALEDCPVRAFTGDEAWRSPGRS